METNANYHAELNKRLSQLPAEIADGVKPEAIVKTMTESFRQQIQKTGLQETQALLSAATGELRTTARTLDAAVKPITARYNSLASEVEKQAANLDVRGNNLARTADQIQKKNAELVGEVLRHSREVFVSAEGEVRSLNWMALVLIGLVILLLGIFSGVTWEQRAVRFGIGDLQNQVNELQQTIKDLPATLNPPQSPKRQKKGQ